MYIDLVIVKDTAPVESLTAPFPEQCLSSKVSESGVHSAKGRWVLFELHKDRDVSGGISISREYIVAERPAESGFRDACNIWFENADGSLGLRFGGEALSDEWEAHEIWLDVAFNDGIVWSARSAGAPLSVFGKDDVASVRGAAGIRFDCLEPFKTWLVSVDLEADRLTTEQLCADCVPDTTVQDRLRCELILEMVAPPWIPGSLDAKAKARLEGEDGDFMSPRYEQLCIGQGSLQVHDRIVTLQGNGLRIRRSGGRAFQGFQGHCWQSAIFPDGTAFGCNSYPPKAGETDAFSEACKHLGCVSWSLTETTSPSFLRPMKSGSRLQATLLLIHVLGDTKSCLRVFPSSSRLMHITSGREWRQWAWWSVQASPSSLPICDDPIS